MPIYGPPSTSTSTNITVDVDGFITPGGGGLPIKATAEPIVGDPSASRRLKILVKDQGVQKEVIRVDKQ